MARVCLVGATHIGSNPRLVREADLLHDAGHQVRVVFRQEDPARAPADARLIAERHWQACAVDIRRGTARWLWHSVVRRSARAIPPAFVAQPLAYRAAVKGFGLLAALAAAEPADWFIAHAQTALPAAAFAARRWNARLGFDCEDLLAVIEPNGDIYRQIEGRFIPECSYVSGVSNRMMSTLARDHQMKQAIVLYNAMPVAPLNGLALPQQRKTAERLRLHWFGQTLGPQRGLEDAARAIALLDGAADLYLRGDVTDEYRRSLLALAGSAQSLITFLPRIDHDLLVASLAEFDVGLALELPDDPNERVTNKLFGYLAAGLAIAATDTPGQREVLDEARGASIFYSSGDPGQLAASLKSWIADRSQLRDAQDAAWRAARERFCWEIEGRKLLNVIESETRSHNASA
jgi:glycosyltransferase involved in cell wall biosynthesis